MSNRAPDKSGEFPFPLTRSARESKYLIWLRNHANYLSVSGITDYFRAIGILVRGVLANFLIFLPYLLAVSLAVALAKITSFPPFLITKILAGFFVVWILVFSLLTPVYRISRYRLMRSTGSDSDVAGRDWYERTFGSLLFAILVVAAIESLPGMLTILQWQKGWPGLASSIAVAAAIFSAFPKLLSLIGEGLVRQLALIAVGALGVIVPLIVVLFFANFLLLGQSGDIMPR